MHEYSTARSTSPVPSESIATSVIDLVHTSFTLPTVNARLLVGVVMPKTIVGRHPVTPRRHASYVCNSRTHVIQEQKQAPTARHNRGTKMNQPNRTIAITSQSPLVISCDTCVMRSTAACDDCLVTHMCGDAQQTAVVFNFEEQRALRLLANAGMVPTLRHRAVS